MSAALPLLRLQLANDRHRATMLVFFAVGLPLFLQAVVQRSGSPGATRLPAATLVVSSCFVVFRHLGQAIETDRTGRTLTLLDAAGIDRWTYLATRYLEAAVLAVLPLLSTALLAWSEGQLFPFGWRAALAYGLWVSLLASTAIALAGLLRAPLSFQVLNLLSVVVATMMPLFYPPCRVPEAVRAALTLLPPSAMMQALGVDAAAPQVPPVASLGVWATVAGAMAVARFPWKP